jgi:hypothetical protein
MYIKDKKINAVAESVVKILEAEEMKASYGDTEKEDEPAIRSHKAKPVNPKEYTDKLDKKYGKPSPFVGDVKEATEKPTHIISKELLADHKRWMDSEGFDTHTVPLPKSHPKHATHVGIVAKNNNEAGYHEDGFARPIHESAEINEADKHLAGYGKSSERRVLDGNRKATYNKPTGEMHPGSGYGKSSERRVLDGNRKATYNKPITHNESIDEDSDAPTHYIQNKPSILNAHEKWMSSQGFHNTKIVPFPKGHRHHDTYVGIISSSPGESRAHENGFAGQIDESVDLEEGSGSKEKQKTPYKNINSPEYRAAVNKQKEKMEKDDSASPGKKLLSRLKGNQYKLDKNHNGKLDAQDFKMLRGEKNESVESIDELSKDTLMSYVKKGEKQQGKNFDDILSAHKGNDQPKANKANAKYINREKGLDRAVDKMYSKYDKSKTESMYEDLKGDMHPDADKVLKHIKPEFHSIYKPFLKKGMYKGNYADRAAVLSAAEKSGHTLNEKKGDSDLGTFTDNNMGEMTDAQMKDRERIVKSMKKNLAGFKERYGNRAKNVMYATATKQAMKDEAIDPNVKTTDTLAGRIKGGDENQHTSYKVKLKTEAMGCENTPMTRATNLAKAAYNKLKNETMMGKAGGTSEEKE